ncbi:MAG: ABC transporter substrate-binding protein [Patescibacteria group bacterium]
MKSPKTKKKLAAAWGKTKHRFAKIFKSKRLTTKRNLRLAQEKADKNLVYSLATSKIPTADQMKHLQKTLTPKEKWLIRIALILVILGLGYLTVYFWQQHTIAEPMVGGIYYEGVVGYPRNINPLYSDSRPADQDLTQLIFSSLFKYDTNGRLVGDLAEKIETTDNKEFLVTLRSDVKWHNGENLSVDDIVFTFNLLINSAYGSPWRQEFLGVTIEKVSDNQVKFSLPTVYVGFPHLLTFGILPKNVWENIAPEFAALNELNLEPIGSGPYKFESIVRSKQGEIKEYRLLANPDYYGPQPFIEQLTFRFYPDATALINALNDGDVLGISSLFLEQKNSLIAQSSLNFNVLQTNQEDLIFFNSEKNKNLADLKVRRALAHALDKKALVDEISFGFYTPTDTVLPRLSEAHNEEITKYSFNQEEANKLLAEAGWSKLTIDNTNDQATGTPEIKAALDFATANHLDPHGDWRFKMDGDKVNLLTIRLAAVSNRPAQQAAEIVARNWQAVGVRTVLETISVSELSALINDRAFEAFVFGQVSGADSDIFPFWHSSQIKDGLNIAGYKNTDVDNLLSDARTNPDVNARWHNYREAQRIIADEVPAIPLYEKNYIFVQDKKVKGFSATAALSPSHRFSGIADWFLKSRAKFSW